MVQSELGDLDATRRDGDLIWAARIASNRPDEPLPIPPVRANRKDATNAPDLGGGRLLDGLLEAARASRFWLWR